MNELKARPTCDTHRNTCAHQTRWVVDVETGRIVNAGCDECAVRKQLAAAELGPLPRTRWYRYGKGAA